MESMRIFLLCSFYAGISRGNMYGEKESAGLKSYQPVSLIMKHHLGSLRRLKNPRVWNQQRWSFRERDKRQGQGEERGEEGGGHTGRKGSTGAFHR